MGYIILVTVLLLVQYVYFSFRVGSARGKGEIKAPSMVGDENFERCLRVQLNTLGSVANSFLTEVATKIVSDAAEIARFSHSKQVISNKV